MSQRLRTRERLDRTRQSGPGSNLVTSNRTGGQPVFGGMERAAGGGFSHDFSQVRIHSDEAAARSAAALGALAYTQGNDIYFSAGQFQPGTPGGQQLLAHELAHVVQQQSGGAVPATVDGGEGDTAEQSADLIAAQLLAGEPIDGVLGGPFPAVQRETAEAPTKDPAEAPGAKPGPEAGKDGSVGNPPAEKRWNIEVLSNKYVEATSQEAAAGLLSVVAYVKDYAEGELQHYYKWLEYRASNPIVGGICDILGGSWLPGSADWHTALIYLQIAKAQIEAGNFEFAASLIELADKLREGARAEYLSYLHGTATGASRAVTGLKVTAAAGAVAAVIATGGIAAAGTGTVVASAGGATITGGGLGLLGTSAAAGAGAGGYGIVQDFASQTSQLAYGQREEYDFAEMAKRGLVDAIGGFVGTLTGGALAGQFRRAFGALLVNASDDVLLNAGKQFGFNGPMPRYMLLSQGQIFLADFLSGVGASPLATSVNVVLNRALSGGGVPSADEFVDQVLEDMVKGGAIQLFIGAIAHKVPASHAEPTTAGTGTVLTLAPPQQSPEPSGGVPALNPAFDRPSPMAPPRSIVAEGEAGRPGPVADSEPTLVDRDPPTLVDQVPATGRGADPDQTTTHRNVSPDDPTRVVLEGVTSLPDGLVHYGLTEQQARLSYRESIDRDPYREASITLDLVSGEYVVVQGNRDFVTSEWQVGAEFAGRKWKTVEHFHPADNAMARFASIGDFRAMMGEIQTQSPNAWRRTTTSERIRWRDPVTNLEFITEIGYDASHPEPYWIQYRDLHGNNQLVRFTLDPWMPGSDYETFLAMQYPAAGVSPP